MDARDRNRVLWIALPLAALLTGCGNYTITFEVADIINAPGSDLTAEMLDVDIICLSKKDTENHPEIINGVVRSAEWFKARDEGTGRFGDISPKRIYALRHGQAGDKRDTLLGVPLLSFKDRDDGKRTTVVKINHPQPLSSKSAIVVYGRFGDVSGNVARTAPLVIQPPPAWKKDIKIHVGREDMTLVDAQ